MSAAYGCGDIVLINFPYTDSTGSKVRPALVVSGPSFNQSQDLVFVPISSAASADDGRFSYSIEPSHRAYAGSGLRTASWVKFTKPMTLANWVAIRKLGSLDRTTVSEIHAKIQSVFSFT